MENISASPNLDVQVLLAHLLDVNRTWLLAHPEEVLTAFQMLAWEQLLERLTKGEPLPYVLGEWDFYGLDLAITLDVLIPRPETEHLVEAALDWLSKNPSRRCAVDVGTGSGCIAIALACYCPDLELIASDISKEALAVAAANLERYKLARQVSLRHGDLLEKITGPFDLICANLPYIPSSRLSGLQVTSREPRLALDGGSQGLELIQRLLTQTPKKLAAGGLLLVEIDESQETEVISLAVKTWPDALVSVCADLAGLPRLLVVHT